MHVLRYILNFKRLKSNNAIPEITVGHKFKEDQVTEPSYFTELNNFPEDVALLKLALNFHSIVTAY